MMHIVLGDQKEKPTEFAFEILVLVPSLGR